MSNRGFPLRPECASNVRLSACGTRRLVTEEGGRGETPSRRGGQLRGGWHISHQLSIASANTKRHHSSIVFRARLYESDDEQAQWHHILSEHDLSRFVLYKYTHYGFIIGFVMYPYFLLLTSGCSSEVFFSRVFSHQHYLRAVHLGWSEKNR